MVVWPGDPPVGIEPLVRIARGDACNVSELRLGSHTGTHVDAPYHFVDTGMKVDELPLEALLGAAWVLDCGDRSNVDVDDLQGQVPAGTLRLLLKTRNSQLWHSGRREFAADFAALTLEAARWIAQQEGICLLGVDYLSVERPGSKDHALHHALLEAGVIIVEGLDLSALQTGWYNLFCLPLKVVGGDGAPARAVAIGPLQ
jgi:arylformamidase